MPDRGTFSTTRKGHSGAEFLGRSGKELRSSAPRLGRSAPPEPLHSAAKEQASGYRMQRLPRANST